MHSQSITAQIDVALKEELHLQIAPREGSKPVAVADLAQALRADGVASVEGVIDCATAKELRKHVEKSLGVLCLRGGDEHEEELLGDVLCRRNRFDVKLNLSEPAVAAAITLTLRKTGTALARVLGLRAKLFELGALVADDGAPRQPLHPDTPWSASASVLTIMIALQDMNIDMGPTHFLPRTHTERLRSALWGGDPETDEEVADVLAGSTCRIPLPRAGDAVVFDARTLHCGSANVSGKRRVIFYLSFRARAPWYTPWSSRPSWRGGGFEQPGTLLDSLRGVYCLATSSDHLVATTPRELKSQAFSWWHPGTHPLVVRWVAAAAGAIGLMAWVVHTAQTSESHGLVLRKS